MPDSMFSCRELTQDSMGSWNLRNKRKMKFPRHGHSACSIGSSHLAVTGSRKDHDGADKSTELYNADTDSWQTIKPMNTGRHYHSSCSFNAQYLYVFCGISNQSRRYINSIERVRINLDGSGLNEWQQVAVENDATFKPRQGCGVAQNTSGSILIIGGFNGSFSNETFFLKIAGESHRLEKNSRDI